MNELLSDERRLAEERAKAMKLKENMKGIGSDDYAYNGSDRYSDSRYGVGENEQRVRIHSSTFRFFASVTDAVRSSMISI